MMHHQCLLHHYGHKFQFDGESNSNFSRREICMNEAMIMALVIISIVAVIMIIIGVSQISKKENPVGF